MAFYLIPLHVYQFLYMYISIPLHVYQFLYMYINQLTQLISHLVFLRIKQGYGYLLTQL